ncbi:conserved hypothetical protein [Frankia canadensis]|uniref:Uncharacterized protein n=1 Tax=Frankia canadensis TaxID=1836972 RepID=A0A2I2KN17_9ACTN|nr:hypothetical protein [Frankia canadensis]SNQ47061.1 conserved hypothetical protein [Frankia canadensis]SOU54351.1 conserved hypothetical protein [Frankia canadensis]
MNIITDGDRRGGVMGWDEQDLPDPIPGRCNAARRGEEPGRCRATAGRGTDHVGTGRCKHHGGRAPGGRLAAAREYAVDQYRRFGQPIAVTPTAALRDEVGRTAGLIATIEDEINRTIGSDGQPILVDTAGLHPGPAPLVALHHAERRHLVVAAKAAIDAGVEQAMTDLRDAYEARLFDVVDEVVADVARQLGQDPDSSLIVDAVTRALSRLAANEDRPALGGGAP